MNEAKRNLEKTSFDIGGGHFLDTRDDIVPDVGFEDTLRSCLERKAFGKELLKKRTY